MTDEIKVGTVMIREGTRLPARLRIESSPLSNGWKLVKNFDGHALSRRVCEAGWAFVHMTGEIRATALGFDQKGAVCRAVRRGLGKPSLARSSCLEITQVTIERIFGLLYVTVAARPRLIQEEVAQLPSRNISDWQRARLVDA